MERTISAGSPSPEEDPISYFNTIPALPCRSRQGHQALPSPEDAPTCRPAHKQMGFLTEVGSGIIPWKDIFANAGKPAS